MNEKVPHYIYTTINRWKVLNRLSNVGETKRELENSLDISRSTIDRSIQDLREENILEQNTLEPTLYGSLLYEEYKRFIDVCKSINDAKTILIEQDQAPQLPLGLFENGKIILNNMECPQRILMELSKLVVGKQHIQIAIPVINSWYVEFFMYLLDNEKSVEIFLQQNILQQFKSNFDRSWEIINRSDTIRIETTVNQIPFALSILDKGVVWVCLYNNRGLEVGGVVTKDYTTMEWATNVLESHI